MVFTSVKKSRKVPIYYINVALIMLIHTAFYIKKQQCCFEWKYLCDLHFPIKCVLGWSFPLFHKSFYVSTQTPSYILKGKKEQLSRPDESGSISFGNPSLALPINIETLHLLEYFWKDSTRLDCIYFHGFFYESRKVSKNINSPHQEKVDKNRKRRRFDLFWLVE